MRQEKQAYSNWDSFRINLLKETVIDETETEGEKIKRIARLKNDYEAFFKYYFCNYYKSEPAAFHIKATKRIIENDKWYEVRAWARGLSKSARTMMEVLYLSLTGKVRNVLLISNNEDSAINLLKPYLINLEANLRIINDYGEQVGMNWAEGHFITKNSVSFLAVGAGQSPRGTRNEEIRPDVIIFDDIDTDEEVRNPERISNKWNWIEKAVVFTTDTSESKRIIFCGNIIGKDTCITRAINANPDHVDIINIRDKNGVSIWPQKNKESDIEWMMSKVSYRAAQQEYFNNPISEGTVFKNVHWKKALKPEKYKILVCYTDPSFKDSKKNDFKATVLVGFTGEEFHVIKAYVEQTTTRKMVEWHYAIDEFVDSKNSVYYYMESNFIQDILLNEFDKYASETTNKILAIRGDDRKKPDKFTRIESNLEPLFTRFKLFLNENEKENIHMKRVEEQFLSIEPGSRAHDDAPDAVEGAIWIINNKLKKLKPIFSKSINSKSKKRF